MTNEICEKEGHDFGEEIQFEVKQVFTGTMLMPPDRNIRKVVTRHYKQCKRCSYKLYV